MADADPKPAAPSLDVVRARIDAIDAALLALVDERAALAVQVAVAQVEVEPTGDDRTFWVTDAPGSSAAIEDALGRDGVAGDLIAEVGGLKLFALMGFYQADDERLARAPGRLSGVIGAAPAPFDV